VGIMGSVLAAAQGVADGVHNAPYILENARNALEANRIVTLSVSIQNIGSRPVALQAISAKGTVRQAMYPAPRIEAGARIVVPVELQFYRDVPNAFSLVMDYGLDGINTTLVKVSN